MSWIKVTDRLPEPEVLVLGSDGDNVWVDCLSDKGKKGKIDMKFTCYESCCDYYGYPTHWMEHPALPEKDKDGLE